MQGTDHFAVISYPWPSLWKLIHSYLETEAKLELFVLRFGSLEGVEIGSGIVAVLTCGFAASYCCQCQELFIHCGKSIIHKLMYHILYAIIAFLC